MSNLNAREIQSTRPFGDVLYLEIKPDCSKYCCQADRFAGEPETLSHGIYPTISAKAARKKRDDAEALLDQNIDPVQQIRLQPRRCPA